MKKLIITISPFVYRDLLFMQFFKKLSMTRICQLVNSCFLNFEIEKNLLHNFFFLHYNVNKIEPVNFKSHILMVGEQP